MRKYKKYISFKVGYKMKKILSNLVMKESGQGLVEYGLIILLVALVAIAGVMLLGPKLSQLYTNVNF